MLSVEIGSYSKLCQMFLFCLNMKSLYNMSTMKYIFYLAHSSSFSFVLAPINNKLQYLLVIILDKVKSSQLVALLVGLMSLFLAKKDLWSGHAPAGNSDLGEYRNKRSFWRKKTCIIKRKRITKEKKKDLSILGNASQNAILVFWDVYFVWFVLFF